MSSTSAAAAAAAPAGTASAGAPVTMADWAARQRALKEQDRKSKNASAEALRNYRGVGALRGEETMLTALKEQDRKKKEETAEQMRHYRGGAGLRDEDTKLSMLRQQDRQQKQDAERILHEYRDLEGGGAGAGGGKTRPEQTRIIPDAVYSGGKWNPEEDIAPGSVSNIRESFSTVSDTPVLPVGTAPNMQRATRGVDAAGATTTTTTAPTPPPPVVVVPEPEPQPVVSVAERQSRFAAPSTNHQSNSTTTTSNNTPPSFTLVKQKQPPSSYQQHQQQQQQQTHQGKFSNGYSPSPQSAPVVSVASPATAAAPAAPTTPSVKRLDVKFSFGIVSLADTPSLDGYMVAVKDIVEKGLIEDESNTNIHSHVSCEDEFPPFVNEVEKDDTYRDQSGRSNVKRFLVKASVPIFVKSGFSSQSARRGVIAILQKAIQSGVLLSNAAASGKI